MCFRPATVSESVVCPECGSPIPAVAKMCGECGADVSSVTAAARNAAFGKDIPSAQSPAAAPAALGVPKAPGANPPSASV